MNHSKIDYGIDLGTTNSAICRMQEGKPTIVKADDLKDIVPSCVYYTKKGGSRAGSTAVNALKNDRLQIWKKRENGLSRSPNAFTEFKRTMGTDTMYSCENLARKISSEELSSEVLKALKSFVLDDNVQAAVITVPAKFNSVQKDATLRAAKMAGFQQCELLQEPIAAVMAYACGKNTQDGIWLVFDFGGGTFDAALVKVEDGIMQVLDTEGDNYLGGKNLDYAIVDEILLPYLTSHYDLEETIDDPNLKAILRDALKSQAEEIKNNLSFKPKWEVLSDLGDYGEDDSGEEIELNLTVTQEDLVPIFEPIFKKAIAICNALLAKHSLSGEQIAALICVGGPTHSPILRKMLREQVSPNIDTSIDPMTAVAIGAALSASTIDYKIEQKLDEGVVALNLQYEATSVETIEFVSCSINRDGSTGTVPEKIFVKITRGDEAWESARVPIDDVGDVIECLLVEGRANLFNIRAFDSAGTPLRCFPEQISILQGKKIGAATLPYNYAIEIFNEKKHCGVIRLIPGLEKNRQYPTTGTLTQKTLTDLHPGVGRETIRIPLYEAERDSQGKRATNETLIYEIKITGEDVHTFVPAESEIRLTFKIDSDGERSVSAYFPCSEETVHKKIFTSELKTGNLTEEYFQNQLELAEDALRDLEDIDINCDDLRTRIDEIRDEISKNGATGDYAMRTLEQIRGILRDIETLEDSSEWTRCEKKLLSALHELNSAFQKHGDENSRPRVEALRSRVKAVQTERNVPVAENLTEEITQLEFSLNEMEHIRGFIFWCKLNEHTENWRDPELASKTIAAAMSEISAGTATKSSLRAHIATLARLLPPKTFPNGVRGLLG